MSQLAHSVTWTCDVEIPEFEGPLDLLLHLIRNHELDIMNLSISKISEQYLEYLKFMREMNLDVASEYLVMAATLTYIKSKLILPEEKDKSETGPDPKSQLIKRLIQLRGYKELSIALGEKPRLNRDFFYSKNTDFEDIEKNTEINVKLSNPYQMIESFRELKKKRSLHVHNVFDDAVPVSQCIDEIFNKLEKEDSFTLNSLFPQPYKVQHIISNFLGVLELTKLQVTKFQQDDTFGPIHIQLKRDRSELEQVKKETQELSWE